MRFLASLLLAATLSAAPVSFDKQTLTKDFVAEGCAVADFDHDGHVDVAAGWYIWKGPDFKQRIAYAVEPSHEKGPNKTPFNGATGYSDYFISYAYDFNADGWQERTQIDKVSRSVFNLDVSKDGKTWERKYRFETTKSFQYPTFVEANGQVWFCVTQGDSDASRKERIMFGRLE